MRLTVVELLEHFVSEHGRIGGPYESPQMFFVALEKFLQNGQAKNAVELAWWDGGIHGTRKDSTTRMAEDAFTSLNEDLLADKSLGEGPFGLSDEREAAEIILSHLDTVENAIQGMTLDRFRSSPARHIPLVVARAVEVIASILRVTPSLATKLNVNDYKRLQLLAGRLSVLGKALPVDDLWEVRSHVFPSITHALS